MLKGLKMKKLIPLFLLLFSLSDCKKKDPEPDPVLKGIVGGWRLIGFEKTVNNEKVWEPVDMDKQTVFSFRFDGVMLDKDGLPYCCASSNYVVNGTPYKVVAKAKIPENPICATVNCAACDTLKIQQRGNEMITANCFNPGRSKYTRQ